jgi:GNAT superfamily N-acetyltransferase
MTYELRQEGFVISTDPSRLDIQMIHRFLSSESYWAIDRNLETVKRSIENSLPFGIYQGNRQVGFARVVTDRATFAWLADVFVLDEFRGRGLGEWLIAAIVSYPELKDLRRFVLATRDAHGLYRKFGFTELAQPGRWMEKFNPNSDHKVNVGVEMVAGI